MDLFFAVVYSRRFDLLNFATDDDEEDDPSIGDAACVDKQSIEGWLSLPSKGIGGGCTCADSIMQNLRVE